MSRPRLNGWLSAVLYCSFIMSFQHTYHILHCSYIVSLQHTYPHTPMSTSFTNCHFVLAHTILGINWLFYMLAWIWSTIYIKFIHICMTFCNELDLAKARTSFSKDFKLEYISKCNTFTVVQIYTLLVL